MHNYFFMFWETHILSLAEGKMAFLRLFKPLHKFRLKMNAKPHTHVCGGVCKFTLWMEGGGERMRCRGKVPWGKCRIQDQSIMCAGLWQPATRQTCFRHLAYSHTLTQRITQPPSLPSRHTLHTYTHAHDSMSKLSKECVRKYFCEIRREWKIYKIFK